MWYLVHQQAKEIIAEREREAAHIRLERLVAAGEMPDAAESTLDVARRQAARATLWIAGAAYRLARAIDSEAVNA